jgi:TRAP-type C4-dicarboxylate transport system permease small subunit
MGQFGGLVARLEEGVTLCCFAVMCGFVALQLFFRFALNSPLMFPEEISRYAYVWITFVGLSLATKTREHIRVDAGVGLLPQAWQRAIGLLVDLTSFAILLWLAYLGVRFMFFSRMSISPALEVPLNLVYVAFPLGCLLAALRLSAHLVAELRRGPAAQPS